VTRWEYKDHKEKIKQKHHFIDVKAPLILNAFAQLDAGGHCFGFSFRMPNDIPSSIFYKNSNVIQKPKAKVKYHIKVKV